MDLIKNKYVFASYLNIMFFNISTLLGLHNPILFIYFMPFLYLYTNIFLFLMTYMSYNYDSILSWYNIYIDQYEYESDESESEIEKSDQSDYCSDEDNKEKIE